MLKLLIIIIIIDNINAYSIQECNNTSIETATNDDYLLKDEFKCYNDGICIQINYNSTSFEQICNCRPGYTGKQCTQLMQACNSNPCGSNGYCNSDPDDNNYEENNNNMQTFRRCYQPNKQHQQQTHYANQQQLLLKKPQIRSKKYTN